MLQQRLGAVVTRPYAYCVGIQNSRHVVGMNAFDIKSDGAGTGAVGLAVHDHMFQMGQLLPGVLINFCFPFLDGFPSHAVHPFNGRGQSHGAAGILSTGFKFLGQGRPGGVLLPHGINHVTSGQERRHGFQKFFPSPEYADAERRIQFVAGKG